MLSSNVNPFLHIDTYIDFPNASQHINLLKGSIATSQQ